MKNPTPRDLRNAVVLAVIVTAVVVLALIDPSCRHNDADSPGRMAPVPATVPR